MRPANFPNQELLDRRWRQERAVAKTLPATVGVALVLTILGVCLLFLPSTGQMIRLLLGCIPLAWLVGGFFLGGTYFQRKSPVLLAKRADRILNLPDNLLVLAESEPGEASPWQKAALQTTKTRMEAFELKRDWPIRISHTTLGTVFAAILLTGAVSWLGVYKLHQVRQAEAQIDAARQVRVASAAEVLQDWKKFAEITDDEELKKLFTEAGALKMAVENKDPMVAMLEMNRIEEKMSTLQAAIEKESLAPQAGQIAEGLEAFSGLSALSAALRNKDFTAATEEANKLVAKLAEKPKDSTDLRREGAVAEILAREAKKASERGNQKLSQTLSDISKAASDAQGKGSVPNEKLTKPAQSLGEQLKGESLRQNRGKAAGIARNQLENLRQSMRGEKEMQPTKLSSLSSAPGLVPGGSKAGKSAGGEPQGAKTELAAAQSQEKLTGIQGEGESETRSLAATTGSAASAAGGKQMAVSDYIELSQKAVQDENLPLAHRRVIQSYFQRIRPVTESTTP